jgi:hypothetical protein
MKVGQTAFGIALGLALVPGLRAEVPALQARLECEPVLRPGRILCQLSMTARAGKLVWGDGLVTRAPAFASPLRSRCVAPVGAAGAGTAEAKLALVASEPGEGTLEMLARGVVCRDRAAGEWCAPETLRVNARVVVGAGGPPAR